MILLESFYRLINKYNQKTKNARQYGTEHLLYPAEVPLIEPTGNHACLILFSVITRPSRVIYETSASRLG